MDPRTEQMLAENRERAASAPPPLPNRAKLAMATGSWVKVHGLALKVAAGAAVVIALAAYNQLVAQPAQRQEQVAFEARAVDRLKAETTAKQAALDECLTKAQADADARWNAACKARRQRAGCSLPGPLANDYQQQEGKERNACLMRFSIATQ